MRMFKLGRVIRQNPVRAGFFGTSLCVGGSFVKTMSKNYSHELHNFKRLHKEALDFLAKSEEDLAKELTEITLPHLPVGNIVPLALFELSAIDVLSIKTVIRSGATVGGEAIQHLHEDPRQTRAAELEQGRIVLEMAHAIESCCLAGIEKAISACEKTRGTLQAQLTTTNPNSELKNKLSIIDTNLETLHQRLNEFDKGFRAQDVRRVSDQENHKTVELASLGTGDSREIRSLALAARRNTYHQPSEEEMIFTERAVARITRAMLGNLRFVSGFAHAVQSVAAIDGHTAADGLMGEFTITQTRANNNQVLAQHLIKIGRAESAIEVKDLCHDALACLKEQSKEISRQENQSMKDSQLSPAFNIVHTGFAVFPELLPYAGSLVSSIQCTHNVPSLLLAHSPTVQAWREFESQTPPAIVQEIREQVAVIDNAHILSEEETQRHIQSYRSHNTLASWWKPIQQQDCPCLQATNDEAHDVDQDRIAKPQ